MGIRSSKGFNPTWSCWADWDKRQGLKFHTEKGTGRSYPGWTLLFYGINSTPGSATRPQSSGTAKLSFEKRKGGKNSHFCHWSQANLGWALGYPCGMQNSWINITLMYFYFPFPHFNPNFQTLPPGSEEPEQLQCWILDLNFPNNSMEDPWTPILYIAGEKEKPQQISIFQVL